MTTEEIIDSLRGSAQSLHDVATDDQMNDAEFCAALDEAIFQCEECGWWCDQDEDIGGGICGDHEPEEDDDDDCDD